MNAVNNYSAQSLDRSPPVWTLCPGTDAGVPGPQHHGNSPQYTVVSLRTEDWATYLVRKQVRRLQFT